IHPTEHDVDWAEARGTSVEPQHPHSAPPGSPHSSPVGLRNSPELNSNQTYRLLKIQVRLDAVAAFFFVQRFAFCCIVCELSSVESCGARIGMFDKVLFVLDMQNLGAANHQDIGYQRAMAAPPEDFRAHHCGSALCSQMAQSIYS